MLHYLFSVPQLPRFTAAENSREAKRIANKFALAPNAELPRKLRMRQIIALLFTCVALQLTAFAQGTIQFTVSFSPFPGSPSGNAELTGSSFTAWAASWPVAPDYGRILQMAEDGSMTPVLQFASVLQEIYPPVPEFPGSGGTLYYFHQTWNVAPPQAENLLAGHWYMEISFGYTTLVSQIAPVPEPTFGALFVLGAAVAKLYCRRKPQRSKAHR